MLRNSSCCLITLTLAMALAQRARAETIEVTLQTRDAKTGHVATKKVKLDPLKTAVIVVDPWNYHWCMTWSEQAGGAVPRMNNVLRGARRLGMQVLWAPTDVASMYSGYPQRERALAFRYVKVPKVRTYDLPFTLPRGPCHCGPGIACVPNYGHDAMPPDIDLDAKDLIVAGTQEVYSICKSLGITHLIYLGGAVNICLTGKPEGLVPMTEAGMECMVARDLVEAWTRYDPRSKYTPESGNAASVVDLERAGTATLHFVDELRRLKLWDDAWITEPVRLTPAGTRNRPYFFEQDVTVSLATPWLADAEIRYTLDKSAPTTQSPRYDKPLVLTETTTLRAVAFQGEKAVSLEGSGVWVRLPPKPAAPDVDLDLVRPVTDLYAAVNGETFACLWHPRMNQSFEGKPLRIRGQKYAKGVGMKAPAYIRYDLKPEWKRFVALAGVADDMLDINLGRNLARYPSVVFKVFVDGELAAESPVMRISQTPWRFDVPLPEGSRVLSLAVSDAGDRSPYDLANWVAAGFQIEQTRKP
jgi:hypothetical protein